MIKKKKSNKPRALPGTCQVNMQLRCTQHETMKEICQTRNRTEGSSSHLSRFYMEAVDQYIAAIDPRTGLRKQEPPLPIRPTGAIIIPGNLPKFGESVDCDGFADNHQLFRAMDQSWMMLWAGGPDAESLHVNKTLEVYTGRDALHFLKSGWQDMLHPDDRQLTVQRCLENFKTQKAFDLVYRLRRHDGLYGWIMDHAQPRFREGKFVGYIGTMYQVSLETPAAITPEMATHYEKAKGPKPH